MCKISILHKIIFSIFVVFVFIPQMVFAVDFIVNSDVTISARVSPTDSEESVNEGGGSIINNEVIKLPTAINFSGVSYPLSKVYVLKDGKIEITSTTNISGHFSVSIFGLNTNTYTFSIYGEDSSGEKSSFFSLPIYMLEGTIVSISNINLLPVIDIDKNEVNNKEESPKVFEADNKFKNLPTKSSGDINNDNQINLFDFSILKHWYKKSNPPKTIDLNHDSQINLIDFSIMIYGWTG